MTMDNDVTIGAELAARHAAERVALAARHLRERGITTRQALVEMWAAENRERTVTRRYQGLAMGRIEAEENAVIACTVCRRPIWRAELSEAVATPWRSALWLDEDGEAGADRGLSSYHAHAPE